jgi:hypothetical protein
MVKGPGPDKYLLNFVLCGKCRLGFKKPTYVRVKMNDSAAAESVVEDISAPIEAPRGSSSLTSVCPKVASRDRNSGFSWCRQVLALMRVVLAVLKAMELNGPDRDPADCVGLQLDRAFRSLCGRIDCQESQ